MLTPRKYQQEAIDAAIDYLFDSDGHQTLWLPTAAGKAMIQAEIAKRVYDIAPEKQMICLTDITALVEQNELEMKGQWPEAKTSVYSASFGSKDHSGEIVFCGIQSVYRKADLFKNVSVIFIDEIHRASLREGGMYKKFYDGVKKNNPYIRIIGLSGTPWKLETGTIEGTWICDKITYKIEMSTLFEQGFLCPIITPETSASLDLDGVKLKKSGEFDEDEMAKLFDDDYVINAAIDDAMKYASDRNSGLIFACNVTHAEHIKNSLKKRGEIAEVVMGETNTKERSKIIEDFKNHKLRWLISIGVLTTGFNAKNADLLIMLRATQSSSLWLQILGRVLRTHDSKTNAMVLDYGESISRFGPIDEIGPPPTKEERKQAKKTPFKLCGSCNKMVGFLEKVCPFCQNEFGGDLTPNHGTQASTEAVTEFKQKIREVDINNVSYSRHVDKKGKPSLKITYHNGLEAIDDYLYFEGENWQRIQACRWWEKHAANDISRHCPKHIDTAIAELKAYGMNKISSISIDITNAKETSTGSLIGHKIVSYN